MKAITSFLIAALLCLSSNLANAKKLAKVKAGLDYKPNDDVQIIVNTVGYVLECSSLF